MKLEEQKKKKNVFKSRFSNLVPQQIYSRQKGHFLYVLSDNNWNIGVGVGGGGGGRGGEEGKKNGDSDLNI